MNNQGSGWVVVVEAIRTKNGKERTGAIRKCFCDFVYRQHDSSPGELQEPLLQKPKLRAAMWDPEWRWAM
jgi:hypothetical protein